MARKNLDPQRVTTAAAELVNQEGVQALHLARLAERRAVQPPSLYNHIAGLPDLKRRLTLLNTRLLGTALGQAVMGRARQEALHALAEACRRYALQNPGLYVLGQRSAVLSPVDNGPDDPLFTAELVAAQDGVLQPVLRVVESFGLSGDDALHAVRGLRSLVHGFISLELAGGFGLPLTLDESYRRMVEAFGRGLEAS